MLKLNKELPHLIVIDNKNEVFEGTPYAECEFCFKFRPISPTKESDIMSRHMTVRNSKVKGSGDAQMAVFVETLVQWEGISITGEEETAECNKRNKEILYDKNPWLKELLKEAYERELNQIKQDKAETEKNS